MKCPRSYAERRLWQLEAVARGEAPKCGRAACGRPADPAWVGVGTGVELLYCEDCAARINRANYPNLVCVRQDPEEYP